MSQDQAAEPIHRSRRATWIRPLVVGFVLGALLLGSVTSAAARPDGDRLTVLFHGTSWFSTQDDPSGTVYEPGDEVYGGATLLRFASPHDQIGAGSIHCDVTGAGGSELTCEAAFILPKGKITTQTLFDLEDDWLQPTRKLAITGGTGAYRHASGELTVTTLASGDELGVFDFGH